MDNGFVDVTGDDELNNGGMHGGGNKNNPKAAKGDAQIPRLIKLMDIDRIREERVNPDTGAHEFLIKWKPLKESWENADDIEEFTELVQAFKKRKEKAPIYREEEEQEEEEELENGHNEGSEYQQDEEDDNEEDDNRRHSARKRKPAKRLAEDRETPSSKKKRVTRAVSKRSASSAKSTAGMDKESDSGDEYSVEKILDRKVDKKGRESYFVRWAGFGPEYDSWEPRKNLEHLDKFKQYLETIEDEEEQEDEEEDDGNGEYKVEEILDRKMEKGRVKYFIKWQGFGEEYNSWEPRGGLAHLDVIKAYEAKNPIEGTSKSGGTPKTPKAKSETPKAKSATPTPSSSTKRVSGRMTTNSKLPPRDPAKKGGKKRRRRY